MTLLSSFEIAMEIRANDANAASLTVALLVVVFGIVSLSVVQVGSTLKKVREAVVDKSSDESFHSQPWLLTALIVAQVASGIIVGAVRSPVAQIVVLMVLVVAFHAFAWQWIRSTTQPSSTKWIILALGLVQVVNLGLSFAFVSSMTATALTEGSHSVAVPYIILNSVVILAIFARVFGLTCQQLVMIWDDRQRTRKDSQLMSDNSTTFVAIATPPQKQMSL
ncbi:hypothetical protein Poli38472_003794 [Pythium oligandrum]|uniref:Uncharacterized protein n=1 Tax=Pythium oligandrum TaxID=41045 RepID=A0A8K1FM86_PYTOL|nr:hypothetical protein Poli38472_003794 [Pythium oligandrum]|eukprot:TMW66029.1 hypothetical protein Poli38472_003794 [Pythium oligandrum]